MVTVQRTNVNKQAPDRGAIRSNKSAPSPYAQRTPIVIPWYYTNGSNLEFFEPTDAATHEWDVAMRLAVRAAQYAECERTLGGYCNERFPVIKGQMDQNSEAIFLSREVDACRRKAASDDEDCKALAQQLGEQRGYAKEVISVAQMEEMVVLCHSPVEAGDPAACGGPRLPQTVTSIDCDRARLEGDRRLQVTCEKALNVRRGDLRFHQVNVIKGAHTPSPWGVYSDAEDPLTGETISASINVWSHVTDRSSQGLLDKLRYIKGELSAQDITEGDYVDDWVEAARSAASGASLPTLTKKEVDQRVAGFLQTDPELNREEDLALMSPELLDEMQALEQELEQIQATVGAASAMTAHYAARRKQAEGTEFEAALMTPMVQEYAGVSGQVMSEDVLNLASPLRGANPASERNLYHLTQNALSERGACVLEPELAPAPFSIAGLADVVEQKFGRFYSGDLLDKQFERGERIRKYLAARIHQAVVAHEMGHSVGLRHNFVASADSWQYRPQYWQLRTKNGTVNKLCQDLDPTGEDCVGPRYFDPVTEEENENLIWMFMQASVMDYHGEITQDMLGLGIYDFAAAKMFYGDTVSVNADPGFSTGTLKGAAMVNRMDNFGGIRGLRYTLDGNTFHYSQQQSVYGLIKDCEAIEDTSMYKPAEWDEAKNGTWHPLLDGLFVKVDGVSTRCRQQEVDYAPWKSLGPPAAQDFSGTYRGGPALDKKKRTRMPYAFASGPLGGSGQRRRLSPRQRSGHLRDFQLLDHAARGGSYL